MGQLRMTTAELNQLFEYLEGSDDTNFRIKDGTLQIKNVTDGKYITEWYDTNLAGKPRKKHSLDGEA